MNRHAAAVLVAAIAGGVLVLYRDNVCIWNIDWKPKAHNKILISSRTITRVGERRVWRKCYVIAKLWSYSVKKWQWGATQLNIAPCGSFASPPPKCVLRSKQLWHCKQTYNRKGNDQKLINFLYYSCIFPPVRKQYIKPVHKCTFTLTGSLWACAIIEAHFDWHVLCDISRLKLVAAEAGWDFHAVVKISCEMLSLGLNMCSSLSQWQWLISIVLVVDCCHCSISVVLVCSSIQVCRSIYCTQNTRHHEIFSIIVANASYWLCLVDTSSKIYIRSKIS